jgi:hypothetical protein
MVGRPALADSPAEGAISADHGLEMKPFGRRALLLAALALPSVGAEPALAAKLTIKPKAERARPLGVWRLVDRLPAADVGAVASVDLYFRPAIDIEAAVMRWWVPRWTAAGTTQSRFCVPLTLSNQQILDPMVAGASVPIHLDIPVPVPPRPNNIGKGEQRSERIREIQAGKRKRLYRVYLDLADPETCRRCSFSFNIAVLDDYP